MSVIKFLLGCLKQAGVFGLFVDSGGGGGGGEQKATSYQTNIPEYAKVPFQKLVGQAEAVANQPYQNYTGARQAQFTPMQLQAFQAAQNQQVAPQIGQASGIAQAAAMQGLGQQYNPRQFNAQQVNAGQLGFERVGTQGFTAPGAAQAYMSPYMQNVVDVQQREAQRQGDIARTQRGAQAVGAGAFGGSRQAIMEAEAARNLAQQKGDIQSQGLQSAYQQAQGMFTSDQARALQAQQLNQQAGLTAGQAGLTAYMNAQQQNQQANLEAQRLGEQSRQFGAGLGQQGLQTAIQGAGQLGQLGQQQYGQQMGILGQQASLGGFQQQQMQDMLNQQYGAFQAERNYPYQQIGFLSDILRGTQGTTRTMYEAPPSMMQNLAGIGAGAYGVSRMASGMAEGGTVKSAGLAELALSRMKG